MKNNKTKDILISIIICIYNGKQYIQRCFDSILNIGIDAFEIVVVDDGSSDGSVDMVKEYAQLYPDIICPCFVEHGGVARARNIGIKHSNGKYFQFVDIDDFIDTQNAEELIKVLTDADIDYDVVTFGYSKLDSAINVIGKTIPSCTGQILVGDQFLFEALRDKHFQWLECMYLFRTDYIKENEFFFIEGKIYEDVYLVPRILTSASSVYSLDLNIYNYIIHEGSVSSWKSYNAILSMLVAGELNNDYFTKHQYKSSEWILESMSSMYILAMRSISSQLSEYEKNSLIRRLKADRYILYNAKYFPRIGVKWAVKILGVRITMWLLKYIW